MKRARRVLSHHGSDCPDGPHPIREGRCIILTRLDRPGQPSRAWCTGDWTEGRVYRKHDHTFPADQPIYYGGGFWQRVGLASPIATNTRMLLRDVITHHPDPSKGDPTP